MNESLEKTVHDLAFASDNLREALHKANAVESIILLSIIKKVSEALNEVQSFQLAFKELEDKI
jgi:hypothetical protein